MPPPATCLPTFSLSQRYALAVAMTLARNPRELFVPVDLLAEQSHAPRAFLSKVLQTLADAGVVEGRKGHNGGYRLGRPADSITLAEVVLPFCGENEGAAPCVTGARPCTPSDPCSLHDAWGKALRPLQTLMNGRTLIDVLRAGEGR